MGNEEKKYYVAPGKSICLARGVAEAGEEVKYSDLKSPIPKKDAEITPEEVKSAKKKAFQKLVESEKKILTTVKPEKNAKKADQEIEMKKEKTGPVGAQRK